MTINSNQTSNYLFDVPTIKKSFTKIAITTGTQIPNDDYCVWFFEEFKTKFSVEEFFSICKKYISMKFKEFPNFFDWNNEYQKILTEKHNETLKDKLKNKYGDGDDEKASYEDFQNVIKPLIEKFNSKCTDLQETERNQIRKVIGKRKKAREAGYVFCTDSQSWMHRDACTKNGLSYKEI